MGIGLLAPSLGVGFYGAFAIGKISPDDALWRIWGGGTTAASTRLIDDCGMVNPHPTTIGGGPQPNNDWPAR
jgi:hypothetical protein